MVYREEVGEEEDLDRAFVDAVRGCRGVGGEVWVESRCEAVEVDEEVLGLVADGVACDKGQGREFAAGNNE